MSQQGTNNHPPVPLSALEVTPAWVSQILRVQISTENFETESNIQAGSGFLSCMVRLRCRAEKSESSSSDDSKEFKLIVKLLPESDIMHGLVTSEGFDKTEINFYQKTMHDLIDILPELQEYLCPSPYGHIQVKNEAMGQEYASVLVLQDLKPQGYYSINFAAEETHEQIQEVLTFMAKFHYAGLVLEKNKGGNLPKVYDFLQGASGSPNPMFYDMAKGGFQEIIQLLKDNGGQVGVIESYQKLAPYSDQIINKVDAAGRKFACLIHGDLWSSNLLFNDSPNLHTKVIDWQLLGYKDPNYDLAVTIVSSIPMAQLNKGMIGSYLEYYYTTFVAQCVKVDSSSMMMITRDWEEFSQFFYTWGMSYTFLWFLMASDPFLINVKRLVKVYEFLATEVNIPEFLFSQIEMVI